MAWAALDGTQEGKCIGSFWPWVQLPFRSFFGSRTVFGPDWIGSGLQVEVKLDDLEAAMEDPKKKSPKKKGPVALFSFSVSLHLPFFS